MIKKIPFRFAANSMLVLLSLVIVFHSLILAQVLPYDIVWGGNLQNIEQMIAFEIVSILINLLMIATLVVKLKHIKNNIHSRLINLVLWLFVVLFALNTIGNLFSESNLETIIFTPVTLISAFLWYRIVIEGKVSRK